MATSQRGSMAFEVERSLRTIFKRCVQCPDTTPSCPTCKSDEICSLVPVSCNSCPYMTCIQNPSPAPSQNSGPNVGAIAGGVVGGVAAVAIVVFFVWFCWIRKRRQQQEEEWEAQEEEWEGDDIAQQKARSFDAIREDAASTRTRGSLANSILSRASNIIQIAYIPGVTNRNGSRNNSLLSPVPPVPAARRSAPKSPLSNEGDALFFRPSDLRDSSYSATSSIRSANSRDTQFMRQSITPSLARSSLASEVSQAAAAAETPVPARTVMRAAPRMVSVKSVYSGSGTETSGSPLVDTSENPAPQSKGKGKGVQILVPGQPSDSSSVRSTGSFGKAQQVTVAGKGRFSLRQPSDASTAASTLSKKHAPAISSPLAESGNESSEYQDDNDEHSRAWQSPVTDDTMGTTSPPLIQPSESPFYDTSERSPAPSLSPRPNPYAVMSSTVRNSVDGQGKRGGKPIGGLSAVIEEATKRAKLVPSHDGLGGKREGSPFSDENATEEHRA